MARNEPHDRRSRSPRPLALTARRSIAERNAAVVPITRTNSRALVSAVYSNSRVSSGESSSGRTKVTRSNWLPWLRCTVIACTVCTSASRPGA